MPTHRVLIVAENVSSKFGGEAFLPLHYFEVLRKRGIETFLLTHARVKRELLEHFPEDGERITFIPDTKLHVALWKAGTFLPQAMNQISLDALRNAVTEREFRQKARELVSRHDITLVHQPIPVSPRRPSGLYDLGAPVVIGPMNGNMSFPDAFAHFRGRAESIAISLGRQASEIANRRSPGKIKASCLLVANARTRAGLPACAAHVPVVEIVENGVDLARFAPVARRSSTADGTTRFVFVGRLVDWKAVDILLHAMAALPADSNIQLDILGDGDQRASLELLAQEIHLEDRVNFLGFLPQEKVAEYLNQADALVLSSLYECGGAVVLEAMAKALPVIATDWGGPSDYLDETCGVLIEPSGREALISGFASAMQTFAADPELRVRLGRAGRQKIEREYDWERKVDQILKVYENVSHK